jgi:hypothetical protein
VPKNSPETGKIIPLSERRFTAQRQVLATLRPGVAASELPVHERDVAQQIVLTEQRHVYIGQLTWTGKAAARLTAHAARCGGVAGGHFVIFHGMVTADSDGQVEVCVPVRRPPQDPAELAWRAEPAHREAFIPATRTHFEIPAIWSIYDRLARWAAAPGHRRAGAPREVYRPEAEPLFALAGQQICDVAIPLHPISWAVAEAICGNRPAGRRDRNLPGER